MKLLVLVLLASCSSTMVQKVGENSQYAPKGYKQKGIVKYLNQGADFVIKMRREDAFKQMYEACGGPDYSIIWEGDKPEGRMISSSGAGWLYAHDTKYMYIEFQCQERQG